MLTSANEVNRRYRRKRGASSVFLCESDVVCVMTPCILIVTYIAGICCLFKVKATLKMKAATSL